ncbi:hypothetical protein FBQ85_19315, partial [Cytophagia bacterium CHB2]|nr:hypothetical protein [Cytophagia bacterium CHB2]
MKRVLLFFCFSLGVSCAPSERDLQTQAQAFLDEYTVKFKALYYLSALAEWASNTNIVEGDTTNA